MTDSAPELFPPSHREARERARAILLDRFAIGYPSVKRMSDEGDGYTPIDRRKIEMSSAEDVAHWAGALRVSVEELRMFVRRVGPMTADVRLAIAKTRRATVRMTAVKKVPEK